MMVESPERKNFPSPEEAIEEATTVLKKYHFRLERLIGAGSYSNVYLCRSLRYNADFAIKQIFTNFNAESAMQELKTLVQLNHPNIIQIFDYFVEGQYLYYVFEYCPNGSIMDRITKEGPIPKEDFLFYCRKIIDALYFCYTKNIAHNDIKPANILLDSYGRPKLADFGISFRTDDSKSVNQKFGGSLQYMAPELIKKIKYDPFQADIWSLGVTFYHMAVGVTPWHSFSKDAIKSAIVAGNVTFPPGGGGQIFCMISKMLQIDWTRRITIEGLMKSQLFREPSFRKKARTHGSKSTTNLLLQNDPIKLSQMRIVSDNGKRNQEEDNDNIFESRQGKYSKENFLEESQKRIPLSDDKEEKDLYDENDLMRNVVRRSCCNKYPRAFKHVLRAELKGKKQLRHSMNTVFLMRNTFPIEE